MVQRSELIEGSIMLGKNPSYLTILKNQQNGENKYYKLEEKQNEV